MSTAKPDCTPTRGLNPAGTPVLGGASVGDDDGETLGDGDVVSVGVVVGLLNPLDSFARGLSVTTAAIAAMITRLSAELYARRCLCARRTFFSTAFQLRWSGRASSPCFLNASL